MAKPLILIVASIPVILAILIAIPMITSPQIPFNAANADDQIALEFTKHHLKKISFGITDRLTPQKTEILTVSNDGTARYLVTSEGVPQPEKALTLEKAEVKKLTALIKETGFMQLPIDSIPADEQKTEFTKFSLKVTLNGKTKQIQWAGQNATSAFVPPILSQVESSLDALLNKTSAQ
jgi:hypothetical protein